MSAFVSNCRPHPQYQTGWLMCFESWRAGVAPPRRASSRSVFFEPIIDHKEQKAQMSDKPSTRREPAASGESDGPRAVAGHWYVARSKQMTAASAPRVSESKRHCY